jgi:hypothetical protein
MAAQQETMVVTSEANLSDLDQRAFFRVPNIHVRSSKSIEYPAGYSQNLSLCLMTAPLSENFITKSWEISGTPRKTSLEWADGMFSF